jgi:hypothetical protein
MLKHFQFIQNPVVYIHTSKGLKTGKAATALPINVDNIVVSYQLYMVSQLGQTSNSCEFRKELIRERMGEFERSWY